MSEKDCNCAGSPDCTGGCKGGGVAVPDGWKLVPVEPTREMIDAAMGFRSDSCDPRTIAVEDYHAMLAAAPQPPVQQSCSMGVDCEKHGCYAAAHGVPERCGMPEPAPAQDEREAVTFDGKTTIRAYVADTVPDDQISCEWTKGYEECKRRIHAMFEQKVNNRPAQTAPQPAARQEQHPDDAAVDQFAIAMKAKLAKSREKGRHGWQTASAAHLSALLYRHMYKADPLDVANLAMMLHQNGQAIELPYEARQEQGEVQNRLDQAVSLLRRIAEIDDSQSNGPILTPADRAPIDAFLSTQPSAEGE